MGSGEGEEAEGEEDGGEHDEWFGSSVLFDGF